MSHETTVATRLSYPDRPPRRLFRVRYDDVPVDIVAAGRQSTVEWLESNSEKGWVIDSLEQHRGEHDFTVTFRVTYIKYVQISRKSYRSRRMAQYR